MDQTPRPRRHFSTFYKQSAEYPEQLKYRRFGAQWAKKLYDDVEELVRLEKELDDDIARLWWEKYGTTSTESMKALDYHRILVKENKSVYEKWMGYEQLLRLYSQDLCLVNSLFKLPDHNYYANALLRQNEWLFENDQFDLTGEQGCTTAYLDPEAPDFVALVGVESSDVLTKLAIKHMKWIHNKILKPLRLKDRNSKDVDLSAVIAFVDAVTCIFGSLLLMVIMFILNQIRTNTGRIGAVGALGLIFPASAMFFSGGISRHAILSLTAAFFAVASVFVSSTNNAVCKCM